MTRHNSQSIHKRYLWLCKNILVRTQHSNEYLNVTHMYVLDGLKNYTCRIGTKSVKHMRSALGKGAITRKKFIHGNIGENIVCVFTSGSIRRLLTLDYRTEINAVSRNQGKHEYETQRKGL